MRGKRVSLKNTPKVSLNSTQVSLSSSPVSLMVSIYVGRCSCLASLACLARMACMPRTFGSLARTLATYESTGEKSLRTVSTFVTAHTFCASQDTWVFYGWCLLMQGYSCVV